MNIEEAFKIAVAAGWEQTQRTDTFREFRQGGMALVVWHGPKGRVSSIDVQGGRSGRYGKSYHGAGLRLIMERLAAGEVPA